MNKTCLDFRASYLLSDGTPRGGHEADCDDCRAFVRAEQAIRGIIRSHATRWRASIALRERVATTLRQEQRSSLARGPLRRRAVLAATMACVALVGVWVVRWSGDYAGRQRAHDTAELIIADYLKYAPLGTEKVQVSGDNVAKLEAFFAKELSFAARMPRFNGAALVGGRRCSLDGRPAALVFLERQRPDALEPLALFIFESAGEDWSVMEEVPGLTSRRACQGSKRGVVVLIWEERGLVYALAGAEDIAELVSLVADHS
jgi:anti-sigma factor RsiW